MKTTLNPGSEFLMDQTKFVINSINNNTEVHEDLPEEQALQLKKNNFAYRSKAKAKPQRREPVDHSLSIPMNERKWINIEAGNYSLSLYVRGFEESNPSSSTFSESTTRRRRSDSILEDQEFSSESIFTNSLFV